MPSEKCNVYIYFFFSVVKEDTIPNSLVHLVSCQILAPEIADYDCANSNNQSTFKPLWDYNNNRLSKQLFFVQAFFVFSKKLMCPSGWEKNANK